MLCKAFAQRDVGTLAPLPCLFRSFQVFRVLLTRKETLTCGDHVLGRWLVSVVVEELGERGRW
jgi:hypothetical protein